MARLADGERAAIDVVYVGLFEPLRDFCAGLVGGGPDAEDAAQEALLKLFAKATDYEPERDVLAWALTIAAWECRTIRRRRTRSRTTPMLTDAHATETPNPEDASLSRDLARAFEVALGTLGPADREVLDAVLDESGTGPTFRKRKERLVERLRATVRRMYGAG